MKKNCCEPKIKLSHKKRGFDSVIIGIIIATFILLGGAVVFGTRLGKTVQVATNDQASLLVDAKTHNWGSLAIDGGLAVKSFAIQNTGGAVLKLYEVATSCMCTTAQLKTLDQSSRKFGMHEKAGEVFEVKPQETAELVVEFDPAFHGPSGLGPITRTVSLKTNDPKNPSLLFQLTANVVKK